MAGPYGCAKSGNRSNQIDGMKNSSASRACLLVTLGWIALEPIDKPCLGRAEKEPVAAGLLQRDKELLAPVDHLLVDFIPPLELGLERKLAAQWW